ncbi:hypothetical protein [Gorillibacterium massiliense]|uniref:hypothetical protein n=1 Tax=Gorillibacterium massiliense TaxID=1280390 RepID=UPI0004B88D77|nr:hypothetical protein [Gorillibacterium massiliense]
MKFNLLGKTVILLLLCISIPLLNPHVLPRAHAGFFSNVGQLFKLPDEVDKLKENYQQVQDSYEKVQDNYVQVQEQYSSTLAELDQAKETAEQFRQDQLRLVEENRKLAEQNKELAASVDYLKKSEQQKIRSYNQLRSGIVAFVGIVLLLFFSGRLLRLVIRRRA